MQVVLAGTQKLLLLELENDAVREVATQAGFQCKVKEGRRAVTLDLIAQDRQAPLLLFDASDPGNLGWFSRCQFYVDGRTGTVLQTPFRIGNLTDRKNSVPNGVRVQIDKELPESFRMPARQPVTEQVVYSVLFNFLTALQENGVALCGGSVVRPLAGRGDGSQTR